GAMYLFIKLDPAVYPIKDDEKLVLDLLLQEKMLIVQGSAFNWPATDHYRFVFLSREDELTDAIQRFARFLSTYKQ
ncbi:MAG: aminotransferase, partial [Gammaproteobacteria bacterium]|nr:aminotransferase [Gammaproteobacteria bacterium]